MLPLIQVLDTYSAKSISVPDASLRSASNIGSIEHMNIESNLSYLSTESLRSVKHTSMEFGA